MHAQAQTKRKRKVLERFWRSAGDVLKTCRSGSGALRESAGEVLKRFQSGSDD